VQQNKGVPSACGPVSPRFSGFRPNAGESEKIHFSSIERGGMTAKHTKNIVEFPRIVQSIACFLGFVQYFHSSFFARRRKALSAEENFTVVIEEKAALCYNKLPLIWFRASFCTFMVANKADG